MRIGSGWKRYGAAVVLVGAGIWPLAPLRPAVAAVNFAGVATADAARVTVIVPNAPASSNVVDTGVTSAQAVVTSAGTSQAYGSNPYPGDNAVSLPGTLAGFGAAGIPEYPLYAASRHPNTPKAEIGQGPFRLAAASTATSSEGLAVSGQAGEQDVLVTAAMTSVRQEDDGGVISEAKSRVSGFTAGPLAIASIVSSSLTRLPANGGELEKAASLEVTGATVNGVAVQVSEEGLVIGDQTVPADGAAVQEALDQAGVSVEFIAPEEMPNGIVAAGLRVSSMFTIPGNAPSEVVWMFGRTLALIDAAQADATLPQVPEVDTPAPAPPATPEPAASPPAPTTDPGPPATPLPAAGAAVGPAPASVAGRVGAFTPTAGVSPGARASSTTPAASLADDVPSPAPVDDSSAIPAETAPPPAVSLTPAPQTFETAAASLPDGDGAGVYLLLVAGAAAIFVVAQGFGLMGVRGK